MLDSRSKSGTRHLPFPSTHWSLIRRAARRDSSEFSAAAENLARRYWRPVYAYIRRRWSKSREEAQDLTQEFFLGLWERNPLENVSPDSPGKFRSYVMKALDNLARLQHRFENRKKRGGGRKLFSLEVETGAEPADSLSPEEVFRKEWIQSVMNGALEDLAAEYREKGWEDRYRIFHIREVAVPAGKKPSYEDLARQFGIPAGEVKNALYVVRLHLKEKILERLRETVTSEENAQQEMLDLFGSRP